MPPELLTLIILTIAMAAVGLLVLADRAGWQSPLPRLPLSQKWVTLFWVLVVVMTTIQAVQLARTL